MTDLNIINNTIKLYTLRYWKCNEDIQNGVFHTTIPRSYLETLGTIESYLESKYAVFIEMLDSDNNTISTDGDISDELRNIIVSNNYIKEVPRNFIVRITATLTKNIAISSSSPYHARASVMESFFNGDIHFNIPDDLKSINFDIVSNYHTKDKLDLWTPYKKNSNDELNQNIDFTIQVSHVLTKDICVDAISKDDALFEAHCKFRRKEFEFTTDDLSDIEFKEIFIKN